MTTDLAALALHEPYIASNSLIIDDGICLSIVNIDFFTFPSLPTPLLFTNVLHVFAISKNHISISAFYANNHVNVLFFYSFFQV